MTPLAPARLAARPPAARHRRFVRLRAIALITLLSALAHLTAARAAEPPNVVVTIKPIHALVAEVMKGVAEPLLLVDGSASLHTFALKPSSARDVAHADLFIRVSPDLEPFTVRLVAALPAEVSVMTLIEAAGIRTLPFRAGGAFDDHHDSHDHDAHLAEPGEDAGHASTTALDGHIWLDPDNAAAIVRAVAEALRARDPGHAALYDANSAAAVTRLGRLKAEIAAILAPVRNQPFVVLHDATQYFESAFGLSARGALSASAHVQPSGRRLQELRTIIASERAACVVSEPGGQSGLVATLIEGTNTRSAVLDPEGQLMSPGPGLYDEMMLGMAKTLADCLTPAR